MKYILLASLFLVCLHGKCQEYSILPQAVAKLPWGHIDLIFTKIKNVDAILFYLQQSNERGWSRSVLEEEIRFDAHAKALNFQNNFIKTIFIKYLHPLH